MTFAKNWKFSENHIIQIKEIIKNNAMHIVSVEIATPEEDMKTATDLKIKVTSGDIAVRVRRPDVRFRDLTIRSANNGHRTEIHKLRDGYGDWYLYAWTDDTGICEWILVDIEKMRKSGILEQERRMIPNIDGITGFVSYSIYELNKINAVIKHYKKELQPSLF